VVESSLNILHTWNKEC